MHQNNNKQSDAKRLGTYLGVLSPIEEIDENEYRYIVASGDWTQPQPPARNDATMYNDWD